MSKIFLDNNSTTKPFAEVIESVVHAMEDGFGNASSAHRVGEKARKLVAQSRDKVAALIGSRPDQIIFSSGATESNNWVFQHLSNRRNGIVLSTEIEHSSVREMLLSEKAHGSRWTKLPIDRNGLIQLDSLRRLIANSAFVSCHWVNNETGVVQPVREISKICLEHSVPLHIDASQAVGKLKVDVCEDGIDFMTFTAHKLHGPQGVGALFCKNPSQLTSLLYGGGQEFGLRPGTENLPGIAGFGTAVEIRNSKLEETIKYLGNLRDRFEESVQRSISDVFVNGSVKHRVCNTTNLRFDGVDGQALVAQLDALGIQCSQSSACTAQIPEPSYVLRAMGLSVENAFSSIRFSFSEQNTIEEIDKVVDVLTKRVTALREFSKSYGSQD